MNPKPNSISRSGNRLGKLFAAIFLLVVPMFGQVTLNAQGGQVTVSATLVDVNGEPVIGAAILDPSDQSKGTVSDLDGNFTIKVPSGTELLISCIGYTDFRYLANQSVDGLRIILHEDALTLEETVVVGYGVQKKATLTGAVSAVSNSDIITTKNEDVQNMLAGRVPGLRVKQNSSEPGAFNTSIDIRGFGAPLVIIDGVPRDNMQRLDAEEIESISVLKDASAAVYGVRAANGVILITTKKGKKGEASISYTGNMTFQVPSMYPDMASAYDVMTLKNESAIHNVDGAARYYSEEQLEEYRSGKKQSTDWRSVLMDNYAPQTMHNLNISGGGDRITYFASVGFQYQDSYFKTNSINYQKFNLRSNVTANITDNLKFELNVAGIMDEKNNPPRGSGGIIYYGLNLSSPLDQVWYNEEEHKYAVPLSNEANFNGAALMDTDLVGDCSYKSRWLQTNASLQWDIPWVKGLSIKGMYSLDYKQDNNSEYNKGFDLYAADGRAIHFNDSYTPTAGDNQLARYFFEKINYLWNVSLSYNRSFGKHNVGVLALFESSVKQGDNFRAIRQMDLDIPYLFAGSTTDQQGLQDPSLSVLYDYANAAFVGRINYDYAGKYIAEFAFRYDGSSRFPEQGRWGFFPSVSLGYRISEEKFWKNSPLGFINNFKIRASWGKLGDDSGSTYQFVTGYTYPASPGGVYVNESGQTVYVNGAASAGVPNKAITWYESRTFNVGIDAEAWNGLLGVTAEYFRRDRTGLLTTRVGSLPSVVGATMPQENLNGDMTQGFEIELSHRHHVGDFYYSVKGNLSYTRIMHQYWEQARAGNSYENWRNSLSYRYTDIMWGYKGNGQMESWDEIYYNPVFISRNSLPGDYEYVDWNGDGYISDLDKHPLTSATKSTPWLNFGLTFSASYKGFDISMLFQGAGMVWVSPGGIYSRPLNAGINSLEEFMDRWHPEDPMANPYDPAATWVRGEYAYSGSSPDANSDFALKNASYLRLKNLEIGYSFPQKWLGRIKMKGLRVYFSGYDLLTFTGLKYLDPEYNASNDTFYPISRTFTLGLNVKF